MASEETTSIATTHIPSPAVTAASERNRDHPVWDVYNDYRTTIWNEKIQRAELRRLKKINNWIEIPLAVLASSSVTSIYFWTTSWGRTVWSVLSVATAILAIVKPFLKIPQVIEQRGQMLGDYCSLENALEQIVKQIKAKQKYDEDLKEQYLQALKLKSDIKKKCLDVNFLESSQKIKDACREKVDRQFPAEEFFIPKE